MRTALAHCSADKTNGVWLTHVLSRLNGFTEDKSAFISGEKGS